MVYSHARIFFLLVDLKKYVSFYILILIARLKIVLAYISN